MLTTQKELLRPAFPISLLTQELNYTIFFFDIFSKKLWALSMRNFLTIAGFIFTYGCFSNPLLMLTTQKGLLRPAFPISLPQEINYTILISLTFSQNIYDEHLLWQMSLLLLASTLCMDVFLTHCLCLPYKRNFSDQLFQSTFFPKNSSIQYLFLWHFLKKIWALILTNFHAIAGFNFACGWFSTHCL